MQIKVHEKQYLCLHTQLATGEYKGRPFRLIQNVGNGDIWFEYDGKQYVVTLQAITEEILELIDKTEKGESHAETDSHSR